MMYLACDTWDTLQPHLIQFFVFYLQLVVLKIKIQCLKCSEQRCCFFVCPFFFSETKPEKIDNILISGTERKSKMVLSYFLFKHQETKAINGQDIKLRLKLSSKDHTNKVLSVRVNAQAMRYNGNPADNILNKVQHVTLLSGQGLQFLSYNFGQHCNLFEKKKKKWYRFLWFEAATSNSTPSVRNERN